MCQLRRWGGCKGEDELEHQIHRSFKQFFDAKQQKLLLKSTQRPHRICARSWCGVPLCTQI